MKHWSKAVLLCPADKSHYPFPLLASATVSGCFLIRSMYRSGFTVTGSPSASSNVYGLIMPLRHNPHQTVIFFHTKWAILMIMKPSVSPEGAYSVFFMRRLFVHETTEEEIFLVTEKMKSKKSGLSSIRWLACFAERPCLHRSEVVKSAFYMETSEGTGVLYAYLNSMNDLSCGTNALNEWMKFCQRTCILANHQWWRRNLFQWGGSRSRQNLWNIFFYKWFSLTIDARVIVLPKPI